MKSYLPKLILPISSLLLAWAPLYAQNSGSGGTVVQVVAPDPTALAGTSSGAFTLIRYGPTNADLAVSVTLSGSASNGVDYVQIPDTITIPAGSLAADVPVNPIVDMANPGNKDVVLMIDTNANYGLMDHRAAEVRIIYDVFDFLPPTLAITSPTNNSVFTNPPAITITAEANDPGVNITSVSFYANDRFLGRAANSPYSLVWSNPPAGHFALFARAVDQFGRSALSAAVQISVSDLDPVVTLTSPTDDSTFLIHSDIPLSADVTDPDPTATIASVAFYANDHLLGTVTSAPYSMTWSNAPAGFFAVRAVAIDSTGDKGYSRSAYIDVTPLARGGHKTASISR
jgi:hypothetical protein